MSRSSSRSWVTLEVIHHLNDVGEFMGHLERTVQAIDRMLRRARREGQTQEIVVYGPNHEVLKKVKVPVNEAA